MIDGTKYDIMIKTWGENMKIAIGSDHSALELKNHLVEYLTACGHEVIDHGTMTKESCDYNDYGILVAKDVQAHRVDRGIVLCFTGIGMSIVANKVKGVRCALVNDAEAAELTREHNDSNCLALSARLLSWSQAEEIVTVWLKSPFSTEERHQRRVRKILKLEEEEYGC